MLLFSPKAAPNLGVILVDLEIAREYNCQVSSLLLALVIYGIVTETTTLRVDMD